MTNKIDPSEILIEVKTLIGIPLGETDNDDKLNLLIRNAQTGLKIKLKGNDIPQELSFIITELAILRYNKLGNEGIKSATVDVLRQDFVDDEWSLFQHYIDDHLEEVGQSKPKGTVKFF